MTSSYEKKASIQNKGFNSVVSVTSFSLLKFRKAEVDRNFWNKLLFRCYQGLAPLLT